MAEEGPSRGQSQMEFVSGAIEWVMTNAYMVRLLDGEPAMLGLAAVSIIGGIIVAQGVINALGGEEEVVKKVEEPEPEDPPRDYTVEQLREFDGTDGKPIYVALCREVFDVSEADGFYGVEGGYHCFAGREASRAMAKMSFEEEDLSNINTDDLGPFDRSCLEDWYDKYKHYKNYPVRGKVSIPPAQRDFTKAELLEFKGHQGVLEGRVDAAVYMAIKGNVLDVSYGGKEMYGEGGPYYRFAGLDASRALGKMSFEPADVASCDLSDLTPEQLKVLDDWETKFLHGKKYPVVGRLVE
jgi:predicted heme/steroid binding protein